MLRELHGIYFASGSDDHDAPFRMRGSHCGEKLVIHSLVHHAEETEPRCRQTSDIRGYCSLGRTAPAKMFHVDSAAVRVAVRVQFAFRTVYLRSTRKDDIRQRKKLPFAANQL